MQVDPRLSLQYSGVHYVGPACSECNGTMYDFEMLEGFKKCWECEIARCLGQIARCSGVIPSGRVPWKSVLVELEKILIKFVRFVDKTN